MLKQRLRLALPAQPPTPPALMASVRLPPIAAPVELAPIAGGGAYPGR
jgi:hypothetical protein